MKISKQQTKPRTNGKLLYMFPAAILKGVIEHDDGTAYFGSLVLLLRGAGAWAEYRAQAIKLGWLTEDKVGLLATDKGRKVYAETGLGNFSCRKYSRAYGWDWANIIFKPEHL